MKPSNSDHYWLQKLCKLNSILILWQKEQICPISFYHCCQLQVKICEMQVRGAPRDLQAGDPLCAPTSSIMVEAHIALLRSLHKQDLWRESINSSILSRLGLIKKLHQTSKQEEIQEETVTKTKDDETKKDKSRDKTGVKSESKKDCEKLGGKGDDTNVGKKEDSGKSEEKVRDTQSEKKEEDDGLKDKMTDGKSGGKEDSGTGDKAGGKKQLPGKDGGKFYCCG